MSQSHPTYYGMMVGKFERVENVREENVLVENIRGQDGRRDNVEEGTVGSKSEDLVYG